MAQPDTTGILEEFQQDLIKWWRLLPNKGFFFILLASWLALFHWWGSSTLGYVHSPSLFTWMRNAYAPTENDIGDDRHGMFIPFVVAGLFWWKRRELMAVPVRLWWPGFVMVVAALILHVVGYAVQQPRVSILALFAGVYGLTGLAWGRVWLAESFFPFFLFIFCIPLGSLAESITFNLRLMVSELVQFIASNVLAIDVIRRGTALMDPTGHYQYEVAAACAGMRSLVATVGLAVIYAFISFPSWWKRGVLIAAAFPLAVLGNLVRMLTIIIAAAIGGQSTGNHVHEGGPLGIISLLPYCIPFGGLLLIGYWLGDRRPAPASHQAPAAKEAVPS